jgi:hypothetical protein
MTRWNWVGAGQRKPTPSRTPGARRPSQVVRLALEYLNDRVVPATLTVHTLADTTNSGLLSLRDAIGAVNAGSAAGLPTSEQAQIDTTNPFGTNDTIQFASAVTGPGKTSTLSGTELLLTRSVTVTGPGAANLTVNANNLSRVFDIGPGATVAFSGLTVTGGRVTGTFGLPGVGGGIANQGALTVSNSVISGNTASTDGGGLCNYGGTGLTLNNCTISGNTAQTTGGGVYSEGALLIVNGCTITGNSAAAGGGLAGDSPTESVTGSTITNNSATAGAGIYVTSGHWTVTGSTISGNQATSGGGGIDNQQATLTLANSTISGNTAGTGGGIYLQSELSVYSNTLTNVTISNNRATSGLSAGGGLFLEIGSSGIPTFTQTATLRNTIVAGNFGGAGSGRSDVSGPVVSTSSFNLIGDGTHLTGISNGSQNNQVGTATQPIDPLLAPLGNFGGATMTMALQPGSPAIDTGDDSVLATFSTDQRGLARQVGAHVDIGADEFQAVGVKNVTSTSANGAYGAGAAINIQVSFSAAVTVTGTPQLTLNTGAAVNYTTGSGTNTLTFAYTVAAGDNSPDLDYLSSTALTLNGGTITDSAHESALLGLPAPGAGGSLGANKALVIDTTAPALTITPNGITTTDNPVVFTFRFNEPVTGFSASDVEVSGGTAGTFTPMGNTYTLAVVPAGPGTVSVSVAANAARDAAKNGNTTASASITVPQPPPATRYAVGSGSGPAQVAVYDARTGALVRNFVPFPGFDGGVTVATGDVNHDGTPDVIVGTATGFSHVKVFDGASGNVLFSFFAFAGFDGGINVAAGDVTGDGFADVIVGTATGFSHVKVFDGRTGAELRSFIAFPGFLGGVTVGAGDVYHTGVTDVIVGTATATSVVGVFDGRSGAPITQFQTFPGFQGGVNVGAGDLRGTGLAEILVGANTGAGSDVKAFDGTGNTLLSFTAYSNYNGSVRVGSLVAANGRTEVLTGPGPGADPHVEPFDGPSLALVASFDAFDPGFRGGIFVG